MQLRTSVAMLVLYAAAFASAAAPVNFINVVPQTPAIGFGGPPSEGCMVDANGGFCAGADLSCVPAGMAYMHRMCGSTYIHDLTVGRMPALTQLYGIIQDLTGELNALLSALMKCPAGMQPTELHRCEACPPDTYSDTYGEQMCMPAPPVPLCAEYSATTGACTACVYPAVLDTLQNTCVAADCDPGFGAGGDCAVACAQGTYNDGSHNECLPVTYVDRCATYSTTADACTACDAGYLLLEPDNTCIPSACPPGYGGIGCDTQCQNGYYNDGTFLECMPVAPVLYCATYSTTTGVCESCIAGAYYTMNACLGCPHEISPFAELPIAASSSTVYELDNGVSNLRLTMDTLTHTVGLMIADSSGMSIAGGVYDATACEHGYVMFLGPFSGSSMYTECMLTLGRPSQFACVCSMGYESAPDGVLCGPRTA